MADPEESNSPTQTSTLPRTSRRCRIPRLNRSTSVRVNGDVMVDKTPCRPKSMTLSSNRDYTWQLEDHYGDIGSVNSMPFSVEDDSSVRSFGSFMSYNSFASQSQCTEASVSISRPISRSHYGKKYVLHCDRHLVKPEEYLTPTQRKDREIRQIKSALMKQTKRSEEKDALIDTLKAEIQRLQNAIAELQETKHNLMNSSHESDQMDSMLAKNSVSEISFESQNSDRSDMQNTLTMNNDDSGISNNLSMSPRNSAEFEDLDNRKITTADKAVCTDMSLTDIPLTLNSVSEQPNISCGDSQRREKESEKSEVFPTLSFELDKFLSTYKSELDELKAQHREHYQDLKDQFNDRVDDLLKKLSDANTRYFELRPLFDRAQDKIQNIESQLTEVQKDLESQEDYHNQMYLKMYRWRRAFKACLCISVAGLAYHHFKPYISIPDISVIQNYLSPSAIYSNFSYLANWIEFKVQN